jgi:hypothetical protein
MFTLEQKVDLILRYIATNDRGQRNEIKKSLVTALNSDESVPLTILVVDDLIYDMLKTLGMPQHLKGYEYATQAIKLYVSDPSYKNGITKRLYPDIAQLCDTTGSRVERGIRHAITSMIDNGDLSDIERVFGNTISFYKGSITNMEFIIACGNEVIRKAKKLGVAV